MWRQHGELLGIKHEYYCLSLVHLSHNSFAQANSSINAITRPPDGSVARGGDPNSESDSPSPSSQQEERCGVFEVASNTNTSLDDAMDVDTELIDSNNDRGTSRNDGGSPHNDEIPSGSVVEEMRLEEGSGSDVKEMLVVEEVLVEDVEEEELVEAVSIYCL